MQESPSALRHSEDVIAKISNGEFSIEKIKALNNRQQRNKQQREIDKNSDRVNVKINSKVRKNKEIDDLESNMNDSNQPIISTENIEVKAVRESKSRQNIGKQPLRNMGSSKSLTASGKFRKASGGYFKNKLKTQSASEFQS